MGRYHLRSQGHEGCYFWLHLAAYELSNLRESCDTTAANQAVAGKTVRTTCNSAAVVTEITRVKPPLKYQTVKSSFRQVPYKLQFTKMILW
jgi:hypothetical protein